MVVIEFHGYKVPIATLYPIDPFEFLTSFPCPEGSCGGTARLIENERIFRNGFEPWNEGVSGLGFNVECWQCDVCGVCFLPAEVLQKIQTMTLEEEQ